jgi:hypothetical protein
MTIAIKKTPETNLMYLVELDANTTDHPPVDWAHNPDFTAVEGIPLEYWKWDAATTSIQPMSETEQLLVDEYSTKGIIQTNIGQLDVTVLDNFPKSELEGNPLAVHATYKPAIAGGHAYAVWSGAGDDITDDVNGNGNGPLLHIVTEIDVPITTIDIEFNPKYGRIWLHEAYLKFTNGGLDDTISSVILSYPVPLQQATNLDLVLDGVMIKYSTSGPGTGTHGFVDPTKITLKERTFQADGDWDYADGTGLVPNFAGTGQYSMSIEEQIVHSFVNRVPVYGNCSTYFSMSSDETTELRAGYFARVVAHNKSNTVWHCSVLMELYREVTYSP